MYIVENYGLAIVLCVITMLCWGSLGQYNQAYHQHMAVRTFLLGLWFWYFVSHSRTGIYVREQRH